MATLVNGKPIRARGGKKHTPDFVRSLQAESDRLGWNGCSQDCVDDAALRSTVAEIPDIIETKETHIIPRKSISDKQNLAFTSRIEISGIDLIERHEEKKMMYYKNGLEKGIEKTGKMITITNRKILKLSDTTLLNQGNPFKNPMDYTARNSQIRRKGSRGSYPRVDPETRFVKPLKPADGKDISIPVDDATMSILGYGPEPDTKK